MNTEIMERTPVVIATEIRMLQDQAKRMALGYAVEIGRRLIEAKTLVVHGSWGDWLEENLDYSARTAQNLMRLAEEYGGDAGLLGDGAIPQALANLETTKAIALLALPAEQREAFLEEHDVIDMSTRQLQDAIRERDEARQQLEKKSDDLVAAESDLLMAKDEAAAAEKKAADLADEKLVADREVSRLKGLLKSTSGKALASEEIQKLNKQLEDAQRHAMVLEEKLAQPAEPVEPIVVEKVPDDVKEELEGLRKQKRQLEIKLGQVDTATLKFTIHFDSLKETFQQLLTDLAEMNNTDPEKQVQYKAALGKSIEAMKGSL